MRKVGMALAVMAAVSIGVTGCADDEEAEGTIDVTLSDFKIELSDSSAPAGEVTFKLDNQGPSLHEFVVFKTDLGLDELPTDDTGDVVENADFAPLDEIEDIENDASPELKMDLAPGNYVLLCNVPAHFRQGMSVSFTVT